MGMPSSLATAAMPVTSQSRTYLSGFWPANGGLSPTDDLAVAFQCDPAERHDDLWVRGDGVVGLARREKVGFEEGSAACQLEFGERKGLADGGVHILQRVVRAFDYGDNAHSRHATALRRAYQEE